MDFFMCRFLWNSTEGNKKYHLVSWSVVCLPKDQGGLGVLDLRTMNLSLLGKWLWRLENEEGQWQEIIKKKYLCKNTLTQVEAKVGYSYFWKGVMEIKKYLLFLLQEEAGRWY